MDGKLIVIEGGDSSGKATQTRLLADYFEKQDIPVKTISFPRYNDSFYGKLIGRFLKGEFGKFEDISPYIAAVLYALDRKDAREEIARWLQEGTIVIADRYVTSNLAHQAAKLPAEKQSEIIPWIEEMEYMVNDMPRPDIVLYLHVSPAVSLKLIPPEKADIAENTSHQEKAEEVFLKLADQKGWNKIECVANGNLRSREDIHTEILHILHEKLGIAGTK
ncbi:thymidylate kinase [Candidatus Roizmanbacteria bacterium]|nr:thymidylate kinase [Candidatus Roizmanbacteria bacterium]